MARPVRQRLRRLFPPIAWRDEALAARQVEVAEHRRQIGELRERVRELQQERVAKRGPSFWTQLELLRAEAAYTPNVDTARLTPLAQVPFKLRNYMLAQSHGVAVPAILDVADTGEDLDLAEATGRFVVKGDGGAGGRGVLLLERSGSGALIEIGTGRPFRDEEVGPEVAARSGVRPPYFVERFIETGDEEASVPVDVKFFSFYGQVGHVLLRRVLPGPEGTIVQYRYVDPRGSDLGAVMPAQRVTPDIPLPADFEEMVRISRHLSRAVGLPFCRVDLYTGPNGPLLGEITRAPGGRRIYRDDHDEQLGRLWVKARARLALDLARGRPFGALHGDHPIEDLYPTRSAEAPEFFPGAWPIVTAPCENWCAL
ncbi:hypothetical protein LQF12_10810 [Ruania suaedae]|uniref:ATP-grasp fold amidoligase family protein n=1 Tax=Ruania suaedae TaxID=2897774 RepID=UPI001E3E9F38|nr:ATP-grasp fold amidoligase family protein [Ruania suaedae]UFU02002.1 hypothetical protein LQF12_10810 [Ruania suaedae]